MPRTRTCARLRAPAGQSGLGAAAARAAERAAAVTAVAAMAVAARAGERAVAAHDSSTVDELHNS